MKLCRIVRVGRNNEQTRRLSSTSGQSRITLWSKALLMLMNLTKLMANGNKVSTSRTSHHLASVIHILSRQATNNRLSTFQHKRKGTWHIVANRLRCPSRLISQMWTNTKCKGRAVANFQQQTSKDCPQLAPRLWGRKNLCNTQVSKSTVAIHSQCCWPHKHRTRHSWIRNDSKLWIKGWNQEVSLLGAKKFVFRSSTKN